MSDHVYLKRASYCDAKFENTTTDEEGDAKSSDPGSVDKTWMSTSRASRALHEVLGIGFHTLFE